MILFMSKVRNNYIVGNFNFVKKLRNCDETEFETNTKSCIYKNGHLETINFKGCTDKFVRAMIEHINKYGEDDDNIVINIKD